MLPKRNRKNKYITRCVSDRTDGYQVRLPEVSEGHYLPGSKECINQLFSVSHYKDEAGCLKAAIRWRNKYLRENGGLHLLTQSAYLGEPSLNSGRNTSGAIGVTRSVDIKESGEYYGYKGQWCETRQGKRKQTGMQFSCNEYGDDKAFKLACRVRFEHKGTIIITDVDAIPCYPDVPYLIKDDHVS